MRYLYTPLHPHPQFLDNLPPILPYPSFLENFFQSPHFHQFWKGRRLLSSNHHPPLCDGGGGFELRTAFLIYNFKLRHFQNKAAQILKLSEYLVDETI